MSARNTLRALALAAMVAVVLAAPQLLIASEFAIEVAGGGSGRIETPVSVVLDEARVLEGMPMDKSLPLSTLVAQGLVTATVTGPGGAVPGQVEALGKGKARLWWIVGKLEAGQKATYRATIERRKAEGGKAFAFEDKKGEHLDLLFGGRKVTRLM